MVDYQDIRDFITDNNLEILSHAPSAEAANSTPSEHQFMLTLLINGVYQQVPFSAVRMTDHENTQNNMLFFNDEYQMAFEGSVEFHRETNELILDEHGNVVIFRHSGQAWENMAVWGRETEQHHFTPLGSLTAEDERMDEAWLHIQTNVLEWRDYTYMLSIINDFVEDITAPPAAIDMTLQAETEGRTPEECIAGLPHDMVATLYHAIGSNGTVYFVAINEQNEVYRINAVANGNGGSTFESAERIDSYAELESTLADIYEYNVLISNQSLNNEAVQADIIEAATILQSFGLSAETMLHIDNADRAPQPAGPANAETIMNNFQTQQESSGRSDT